MNCTVSISRSDLVAAGACATGLTLFDAIKQDCDRGNPFATSETPVAIPWSPLAYIWLESGARRFASWLYSKGLVPLPGFARANLTGANLAGAKLARADLARANLARADLARANLARADLARADLARANLARADLTGAIGL